MRLTCLPSGLPTSLPIGLRLLSVLVVMTSGVALAACSPPQSAQTDEPFRVDPLVRQQPSDRQTQDNRAGADQPQDQPQAQPGIDNNKTSPAQLSLAEKQALLAKGFTHLGIVRGVDSPAVGVVSAVFGDGRYQLLAVFENLDRPPPGQIYQGWLARTESSRPINTGEFDTQDGVTINSYVSQQNLLGHTRYFVTLEQRETAGTFSNSFPSTASQAAGVRVLEGTLAPIN